jgi:hypothetical protein
MKFTRFEWGIWFLPALIFFSVFISSPVFAWTPGDPYIIECGRDGYKGGAVNGVVDVAEQCDFNGFMVAVAAVIDVAIWFATVIAAIIFAYAGFKYMTGGGNPGQIKEATGMFANVFWGYVIVLSAWLLVKFILTALAPDAVFLLT